MFGIGFPELVVIAVLIVLVVGPEQLPQVMRKSVVFIKEARRHFSDIQTAVHEQLEPVKKPLASIEDELRHPDQKVYAMLEDKDDAPSSEHATRGDKA